MPAAPARDRNRLPVTAAAAAGTYSGPGGGAGNEKSPRFPDGEGGLPDGPGTRPGPGT